MSQSTIDRPDRTAIDERRPEPQEAAIPRRQGPERVILVRPHHFVPNPMTETDNRFQSRPSTDTVPVAQRAFDEVSDVAQALREIGVGVTIFEDPTVETPDSVFPNNWFTTHHDGTVVVFPMHAPNRRAERRQDILDHLRTSGRVCRVIDYSPSEADDQYLEGTGAMVLDHLERIAYVCRSQRVSTEVLDRFCADLGYRPVVFDATDRDGVPVYHTNVLMSVGTRIAVIGTEMIRDRTERQWVIESLEASGRRVVDLTEDQIHQFAGNCLEVSGVNGPALIMSTTAKRSLTDRQLRSLEEVVSITAVDVSTIESAGGSIRCMIAGNHLPSRPQD
ncbi:citrulline utilization hydrolase CtlX [Curtobacterium sp. S6]|uniref:citrulline utilization hydrolase CtlX n=1 Tax=Curtobacterium sp. S6 TaxID=1479623 RepID=UPI000B049A89|nr:arginine deiminase-related protein [Curtobacterium sp. S6]